jgi:hypothetical protein
MRVQARERIEAQNLALPVRRQSRRRKRWRTRTLVVIPSIQPRTTAARMIQMSDALVEPTTQPSFTERVLAAIKRTRMTSAATSNTVAV